MKMIERILKKSVVEYFESSKVMNPTQYGFRHKRSAINEILSFYEDISKLEKQMMLMMPSSCTFRKCLTK